MINTTSAPETLEFTEPKDTLKGLYGRIIFNVLCDSADDLPRHHATFWHGQSGLQDSFRTSRNTLIARGGA